MNWVELLDTLAAFDAEDVAGMFADALVREASKR